MNSRQISLIGHFKKCKKYDEMNYMVKFFIKKYWAKMFLVKGVNSFIKLKILALLKLE